ncbi:MAG: hypothetical protein KKI12_09040 [Proteobacteria bacterium]|nr:hypothetical protein [Pseudomonadota bacterium]MBU4288300.1 hypothetical protein [Pseudomonadota bacterium]MCG2713926.1 hypothetical protein [Candidatus Omnitrophota bacterium]
MPKVLEERQGYIESVLHNIKCVSEEISQKSVSKRQFHNVMQQRIINLANSFNLKGFSEYRVDNIRADGRNGRIDVVWLADLRPVTVFEIDSRIRIKSIKKLLAVKVPFRFWVYYGSKNITSLIHKYNSDNLIQVIQLQDIYFKRRKEV